MKNSTHFLCSHPIIHFYNTHFITNFWGPEFKNSRSGDQSSPLSLMNLSGLGILALFHYLLIIITALSLNIYAAYSLAAALQQRPLVTSTWEISSILSCSAWHACRQWPRVNTAMSTASPICKNPIQMQKMHNRINTLSLLLYFFSKPAIFNAARFACPGVPSRRAAQSCLSGPVVVYITDSFILHQQMLAFTAFIFPARVNYRECDGPSQQGLQACCI